MATPGSSGWVPGPQSSARVATQDVVDIRVWFGAVVDHHRQD